MRRAQTAVCINNHFSCLYLPPLLVLMFVFDPSLLQSVGNLRRDLNFAQSVMKAEYESKLMQRAIEL